MKIDKIDPPLYQDPGDMQRGNTYQPKRTFLISDNFKWGVSNNMSRNNEKDWWYNVSYHVDGEIIIPLFIKTPKDIFSYDVSQSVNNSAYTMSVNAFEVTRWVLQYRNIWNKVEVQLFENLTAEP